MPEEEGENKKKDGSHERLPSAASSTTATASSLGVGSEEDQDESSSSSSSSASSSSYSSALSSCTSPKPPALNMAASTSSVTAAASATATAATTATASPRQSRRQWQQTEHETEETQVEKAQTQTQTQSQPPRPSPPAATPAAHSARHAAAAADACASSHRPLPRPSCRRPRRRPERREAGRARRAAGGNAARDVVLLNVGGTLFTTSAATLTSDSSYFKAMFSVRWAAEDYDDDNDGDGDGEGFCDDDEEYDDDWDYDCEHNDQDDDGVGEGGATQRRAKAVDGEDDGDVDGDDDDDYYTACGGRRSSGGENAAHRRSHASRRRRAHRHRRRGGGGASSYSPRCACACCCGCGCGCRRCSAPRERSFDCDVRSGRQSRPSSSLSPVSRRAEEQAIFIDQDARPFSILLTYMRGGGINLLESDVPLARQVMLQAQFFGVDGFLRAVKARAYRHNHPDFAASMMAAAAAAAGGSGGGGSGVGGGEAKVDVEAAAASAFDRTYGGLDEAISEGILPEAYFRPMPDHVVINAGGTTFETSKRTLTERSPYFESLFKRSPRERTYFLDVDPGAFGILLKYMRHAEFDLPRDDVALFRCVLALAQRFEIRGFIEYVKARTYAIQSGHDPREWLTFLDRHHHPIEDSDNADAFNENYEGVDEAFVTGVLPDGFFEKME